MENGIPVAPEGRDSSYALFGDSFSNFNAGKILLILEGIGGRFRSYVIIPFITCIFFRIEIFH